MNTADGKRLLFNVLNGKWNFSDDSAQRTDANGLGLCWAEIGCSNFTVEFRMRAQSGSGQDAEAKFLMAGADRDDERHRIDFLYGQQICRMVLGVPGQPVIHAQLALLSLEVDRDYRVQVRVNKNLVSVVVDDECTVIDNANFGRQSDGKIGFGTYQASAMFSSICVTPLIEKKCFVVMPFNDKCNLLYEQAILPAFEKHPYINFATVRADKNMTTGKISAEILEGIQEADIVIADVTSHNMNVYYEIGVAHVLKRREEKKGVILVVQQPDTGPLDIPFDLKDWRHHVYQFSTDGFRTLRKTLIDVAQNVVR
jgi:hypothetical protein